MGSSDRALLDRALSDYNNGNAQQAEPLLRDLAARFPHQFEVVETLGLIYAEHAEFERALPFLEAGCRANPSSPQAAANLGAAYLRLNRIEPAVTTLRHAVSLDPKNPQTQSTLGQALIAAKRPRDAAQAFASANAADPQNPDLLYNWALAEYASGAVQQAATLLARIPPSSHSAQDQSLCGDVEEKLGHFDRALVCLQNAAHLDPTEANLNALALEFVKHWSFDAAIKVYEYGLTKFPSSSRLQTGLGVAYYGSSQYEKAASSFAAILIGSPGNALYAKLLGHSCIALKSDSGEACSTLLTYAQNHSGDTVAARLAAASVLEARDSANYGLARILLERALALDSQSAEAYYRFGILDQEEGKWADSIPMLNRAVALRAAWSKAHQRLARAYSHLDQREQAQREASLARELLQKEDTDAEVKRSELKTFILDTTSPSQR